MSKSTMRIGLVVLLTCAAGVPSVASAAAPDTVLGAIEKGKQFLLSKQNRWGHWEKSNKPSKGGGHGGHWGGVSCLNVTALLYAGETVKNEKIKRALDWICT